MLLSDNSTQSAEERGNNMNYALIFAGGMGQRMKSNSKPKQFLEIHGKPVLIYTLEHFDNHPQIDAICVVCVIDWLDYLKKLLGKFGIHKVRWILAGGQTAMESQFIGLKAINEYHNNQHGSERGIVLIHDGVRPLIYARLIADCIESVIVNGSAITVAPATETIVRMDHAGLICSTIMRSECMLARAPQAFFLDEILSAHNQALHDGESEFIDSTTLMLHYGYKVYAVMGPVENIKVTTPEDFYICRALLDARENLQIMGVGI